MIPMSSYLASDFAQLFTYDFPQTITINSISYHCLADNTNNTEQDQLGGPMEIDIQQIHIQASLLSVCDPGTVATYLGQKFIVVGSTLASDGNELILNIRRA